ncbi:MAG: hypothetical protein K2I16_09045 [Muribaculaceae bacterium]|nr:hypothetical protein [Muribaculaceae bacterium]
MINCIDIFPSVSEVDFSDEADITGYAYLLTAMAARNSREENPGKAALMRRQVKSAATAWLGNVEEVIGALSAGDALSVAESYDLVCRLVDGVRRDSSFVSDNRLKAFEARIHGDSTVNQYALQKAVTSEIDRHNPKFFGSPLQWKSVSLDRWHRQFRHGASLTSQSDYDTLQRVSCLLSNDLWAFETRNESRFKQNLFENYKFYLENLEGLDYSLLIANQSLLISSTPYLTQEEYRAYDTQIRTALYNHPATNRFQKASLAITLSN